MFDLEAENDSLTQVRRIDDGTVVVVRHGTNEYEVVPNLESDAPFNVNDHYACEALVAEVRTWIADRRSALHMAPR
jgi:hypothetical protein